MSGRSPRTVPEPVALPGATALVTGGASGIGRATCLALARAGARVLVADIDGDGARRTAAACGGTAYQVDVGDRAAVDALAAEIGAPLDVLVNNAGVGMTGRFLDTTAEDWDWILRVNLLGAVHGCAAFGPAMVERGRGHVVNVSSGLGYTPRATEAAYVTTKAAVLALSQCLRADWHDRGVGVSAVCPGVIDTGIVARTRFLGERDDPELRERARRLFGRGHRPEKVALAILRAIRANAGVVPVGAEAAFGWAVRGLVPARLADRIARATVGGV